MMWQPAVAAFRLQNQHLPNSQSVGLVSSAEALCSDTVSVYSSR